MEPMAPMGSADDEVRECIRRLVAVIRRSSTGDSPVESSHVEHIKKVIRVLSLSEAQVSSMREEERTQVQKIRCNALQKFRLANSVRSSANSSSDGAFDGAFDYSAEAIDDYTHDPELQVSCPESTGELKQTKI